MPPVNWIFFRNRRIAEPFYNVNHVIKCRIMMVEVVFNYQVIRLAAKYAEAAAIEKTILHGNPAAG